MAPTQLQEQELDLKLDLELEPELQLELGRTTPAIHTDYHSLFIRTLLPVLKLLNVSFIFCAQIVAWNAYQQ